MRGKSLVCLITFVGTVALAQSRVNPFACEAPFKLCPDRIYHQSVDPEYPGKYVGHDGPGIDFYSDIPGSGNNAQWKLVLPQVPATFPTGANPNRTGGPSVWNFPLHSAFWLGMVICDSESYPEYTYTCIPDSDENIFDDPDPKSKGYIGHHPGTAYLEVQFYPPGWAASYAANQYTAAVTITSSNWKDPAKWSPNRPAGAIKRPLIPPSGDSRREHERPAASCG